MAASKPLPPTSLIQRNDTHRLVPSRHGDRVLARIAESQEHLHDILELDNATNDRILAENGMLAGIGIHELVFGIPYYRIVNAAFTHAHPLGGRFDGPDRGAWYCGFEIETAQSEVSYHKTLDLLEIDHLYDDITYDDNLADFDAIFHDLGSAKRFARYLRPKSYLASQELAEELLATGSLGVVYPSVRHHGGTCLACFRPALVMNVHKGSTYRFIWDGATAPTVSRSCLDRM